MLPWIKKSFENPRLVAFFFFKLYLVWHLGGAFLNEIMGWAPSQQGNSFFYFSFSFIFFILFITVFCFWSSAIKEPDKSSSRTNLDWFLEPKSCESGAPIFPHLFSHLRTLKTIFSDLWHPHLLCPSWSADQEPKISFVSILWQLQNYP